MNAAFQRNRHLAAGTVGAEDFGGHYLLTGRSSEKIHVEMSHTSFAVRPAAMVLAPAIVAALAHRQIQISEIQIAPPLPDEELLWILDRLKTARSELRAEYRDVARREQAWRTFQGLVTGPLWEAVEDLEEDPYRRQLADVLDAAVTQLQAFQLEEEHLSTIDLTLARLSAPQVTENDVDSCENAWQAAAVHAIPSLGEAFEEWLELSASELDDEG